MLACIICCQGGHCRPLRLAWHYWVYGDIQYVGKAVMTIRKQLEQYNKAWFSKICFELDVSFWLVQLIITLASPLRLVPLKLYSEP